MHGSWGIVALVLAVAVIGCHDKPKRIMRQPEVQLYDLPEKDAEWSKNPPEYPEEKRTQPQNQKNNTTPGALGGMGRGGGGAGSGTGMGAGGPGGPGGYR